MGMDLSILRAIDKCFRKAKELKGAKLDLRRLDVKKDCEIEIGEIVNSLALSMDKVMNLVWVSYVENREKKPNIYFPCEVSEEKLNSKMLQYRLGHLSEVAPEINSLIHQIQPFHGAEPSWWKMLKDLAGIRHERYPEILNPKVNTTLTFGRNQSLVYIEDLSARGGVVNIKGAAWDPVKRQAEHIRFDHFEDVWAELAEIRQDPFDFVIMASRKVDSIAKQIGVHL